MSRIVGRRPVEIKVSSQQDGYVPVFNSSSRLWDVVNKNDLISGSANLSGSNNFIGSQTISGSLTVTQGITGSLLGTASYASNAWNVGGNNFGIVGGGDRIFGTTSDHSISIYTSGSKVATFTNSGSFVIGDSVPGIVAQERLLIDSKNSTSYNLIKGKGTTNNYLQFNIINQSSGSVASSDIVATADNGDENTNYIDMGINSSTFAGSVGSTNDAYLYSTGNDLHIGNASNRPVQFFAGGADNNANRKLQLNPNNLHNMTGSLDVSGSIVARSFTGSLQGTASVAVSASYALTASYVTLAQTASYVLNAVSASYAATSSYANNFTVAGTLTAQTIVAQTITSSISYLTGSTRHGSLLTDTHQFTGSVLMTGSLVVNGSSSLSGSLNVSSSITVEGITVGRGGGSMSSNTVVGNGAGQANTTGDVNVFIGINAGNSNTTGTNNTLVGALSGYNNTTGGNNVFIGRNAARYIANGSTSATVINNSIFIGLGTKPLADIQNNQIVIGYDATGLGSNTTVLGNSSTTTTAIYGNLLLGKTTDDGNAKLQVSGSSVFSGSVTSTLGFTGSLLGTATTASYVLQAQSASYWSGSITNAATASYVTLAQTASYILNAISASFATQAYTASNANTASYVVTANTASYVVTAQTASYVLQAVSASFASTASYWSGSTANAISASFASTASFVNPLRQTVQLTGSLLISSSAASLQIQGSGSNVFSVDGTSGRLFSVDDSLSGSLFSVNTAAGLPVVEAFSDNTVRIGQFGRKALFVSQSRIGIGKETPLNAILDISGSAIVTGSITSTLGFTGSLFGTATTASYVQNAVSASYAATSSYSDNFTVGNSLVVTGSVTAAGALARSTYINPTLVASANSDTLIALNIAPTFTNGSFTGVSNYWIQLNGNGNINGTNQINLLRAGAGVFFASSAETTIGSVGSSIPIKFALNALATEVARFSGTNGNLLLNTTTDAGYRLDVSGSTRLNGPLTVVSASIQSQNTSSLASGTQTISTNATASYTAAFYNYTIASGSNTRAGQFIATWNGGSIQYMDNSTVDIGSTLPVALTASLSGANVLLTSTLPSSGWTIKTLVNLI
jgi:hypothetical protein